MDSVTISTALTGLGGFMYWLHQPFLTQVREDYNNKLYQKVCKKSSNEVEALDKIISATKNDDIVHKYRKILNEIIQNPNDFTSQLFAEIMASEIMEEGTYSLETIHRLSLMTRKELEYFYENIAPFWFGGNGFFQLTAEVEVNALISDLDVVKYGLSKGFKKFDSSDEQWYSTDFSNGDKFLIQGKNVSKMNLKIAVLNRFGHDLCKIGVAENKIRKWTPEDKREILRVCKECGIEEIDVKLDV